LPRRHRRAQGEAGRAALLRRLAAALAAHPEIPEALAAFEAVRKPQVAKLTAAANNSAEWYEHFADHMRLPPFEFAMSYITRSGRVDLDRLRATSPKFVAAYEEQSTGH
jgi:hypothetical protein